VTLRVSLDEEGIRTTASKYRAKESFDVVVSNSGPPKHVNLSLTGEASPFVSVEVNNVYVAEDEEETVEVVVGPTPGEVEATLSLSSDYGADDAEVELVLGDDEMEPGEGVEVDESLSQPMKPEAVEDEEIPRADILVGIVLGLAVVLSLLFGILFGEMGIALVVISIAVLGGAMVWTIKRVALARSDRDRKTKVRLADNRGEGR